jgi:hypothetical protein
MKNIQIYRGCLYKDYQQYIECITGEQLRSLPIIGDVK